MDGGLLNDKKSNVNIRLREGSRLRNTLDSPDDRHYLTWYIAVPSVPLLTSSWGPEGEYDHRTNDFLSFEAIFDVAFQSDPKCTATVRL